MSNPNSVKHLAAALISYGLILVKKDEQETAPVEVLTNLANALDTMRENVERTLDYHEHRTYEERMSKAEDALRSDGFVKCDMPACNCGGYHQTGGLRARFDEITTLLDQHGLLRNGHVLIDDIKKVVDDLLQLQKEKEETPRGQRPCTGSCLSRGCNCEGHEIPDVARRAKETSSYYHRRQYVEQGATVPAAIGLRDTLEPVADLEAAMLEGGSSLLGTNLEAQVDTAPALHTGGPFVPGDEFTEYDAGQACITERFLREDRDAAKAKPGRVNLTLTFGR